MWVGRTRARLLVVGATLTLLTECLPVPPALTITQVPRPVLVLQDCLAQASAQRTAWEGCFTWSRAVGHMTQQRWILGSRRGLPTMVCALGLKSAPQGEAREAVVKLAAGAAPARRRKRARGGGGRGR